MSINIHYENLLERHAKLENEINIAHRHHLADSTITKLKKEKLRIKEQISVIATEFEQV